MPNSHRLFLSTLLAAALSPGAPAAAQVMTVTDLLAGDSVRINGDFKGRVVSNVDGTLVVVGKAAPRCTTGVHHGEAPVCDPAPSERHELDPHTVSVERWQPGTGSRVKLISATVLGGVAGAFFGRAVGPEIGLGKIEGCNDITTDIICNNPVENFDEKQRASDRRRGTIFGGIFVATVSAVLAKRLINSWVHVPAPTNDAPAGGFSLSLRIPVGAP